MPQPVRVLLVASDPITQAGLAAQLGGRPEVRLLSEWPAAAAEPAVPSAVGAVAGAGAGGAWPLVGVPTAGQSVTAAGRQASTGDGRADRRLAVVPGGGTGAGRSVPAQGRPALAQPSPGPVGTAPTARPGAAGGDGPDVALVSAAAVDEPTLRTVREVQQAGVPVVLVVAELDSHDLTVAVDAGAVGLLRRTDATPDAVLAAVRGAAAGNGYLPPDLLGPLLRQVRQVSTQVLAPRGLSFSGLTERELTVLRLVAEGCDTREIGRRLCYSERTVKNVLQDVTRRFGLRNRSHAVAYAIRHGLL